MHFRDSREIVVPGRALCESPAEPARALPSQGPSERIHYMDAVRGLAMLLGVFFHAALAYAANFQDLWIVSDSEGSLGIEIFVWFSHLFRMAVFFLISGFFAHLLIDKRGVRGFVNNRIKRIALPFLIFFPLLTMAMLALGLFAISYLDELPHSLQVIADRIESGGERPPPHMGHLWFLYYLMILCVLTALLQRVRWKRPRKLFARVFDSTAHLAWVPLLFVPALYATEAPTPSPNSFSPELWPFGYYGLFFLLGWHLFWNPGYLEKLEKRLGPLALLSLAAYACYFMILPDFMPGQHSEQPTWQTLSGAVLGAYLSVYLTLIALVLGRRFLGKGSKGLRYVSDASYWIYLVHLPLIFGAQILLAQVDLNVWIKFAITSLGTIAAALVVYEVAVRYTPVGALLNGRKSRGK